MLKWIFILFSLVIGAFCASGQAVPEGYAKTLLLKIQNSQPDTNRINLQVDLGSYYLFKPGSFKNDLDSAYNFFSQARELSITLHNKDDEMKLAGYIGNYYVEAGNLPEAKNNFMQMINYYHAVGDKYSEAGGWEWWGNLLYNDGKNDVPARLICYTNARSLYLETNHPKDAARINTSFAICYRQIHDLKMFKSYMMQAIDLYHKAADVSSEAEVWQFLARQIYKDKTEPYTEEVKCYEQQCAIFRKAGRRVDELKAYARMANVYTQNGRLDEAEKQLFWILAQYKSINYKNLYYIYDLLAQLYQKKGDLYKELSYTLEMVNNMESPGAKPEWINQLYTKDQLYTKVAQLYNRLGNYDKSFDWVRKALRVDTRQRSDFELDVLIGSDDMIAAGKPQKAFAFLTSATGSLPVKELKNKQYIYEAFGNYYKAIKQYEKASQYYLTVNNDYETEDALHKDTARYNHVNLLLSNFYITTKQYKKADIYLKRALVSPQAILPSLQTADVHLALFKIDSAAGNYFVAIKHYERYKKVNDSLLTATGSKEINDLEIHYETDQKEKSISLLKSQKEALQSKSKLLESQGKLQQIQFQQASVSRNYMIAGLSMLVLLLGVVYNRFRLKQRSNQQLQKQQKEINEQNLELQGLVIEKDWLLKEVHHRVKNNLQIVMSLLSTQSAYLKNNDALDAIRESQNRVQAISLIHQKLYNSSSVASIDMQAYVLDLVNYLRDCLDTSGRRIRFEQLIEPIRIDLAQAVPIGLILNEAITNAIKYAFDEKGGEIIIALQMIGQEHLLMTIADNGKGLPVDFDIRTASSLGMEMMKALSKQLGGEFKITNKSGTNITVEFQLDRVLAADQRATF